MPNMSIPLEITTDHTLNIQSFNLDCDLLSVFYYGALPRFRNPYESGRDNRESEFCFDGRDINPGYALKLKAKSRGKELDLTSYVRDLPANRVTFKYSAVKNARVRIIYKLGNLFLVSKNNIYHCPNLHHQDMSYEEYKNENAYPTLRNLYEFVHKIGITDTLRYKSTKLVKKKKEEYNLIAVRQGLTRSLGVIANEIGLDNCCYMFRFLVNIEFITKKKKSNSPLNVGPHVQVRG